MAELFQDPSIWLTITSVVIALIALYQTHHQIKLSNKQQLFDRRLDKYLLVEELLDCYREEQNTIQMVRYNNTLNDETLCMQFISFTSTRSLGEISSCIYSEIEQSRNLFLSKLDMLERSEQEIAFLFPKREATLINEFIHKYTELLTTLYTYRNENTLVAVPNDSADHNLTILCIYRMLQDSYDKIESNNVEIKLAKIIHL